MSFKVLRSWSLKTKISLFTLVLFLISIWSLAFYASHILRENMERLLGDQQVTTVSMLAAQVNQDLDDRLTALKTSAERVSPEMLADPPALQTFLEQRPIFQSLFNGGIVVIGIDGTAIADVPLSAGRIGVNYMDVDTIAIALKEGKASITQPVIGKKLLAPVFGMAAPIRDARGRVIGALSGVTNLGKANFLDKISDNHYGKTGGYVLLIPQHRLIVTATDKSRIMQSLPAPGILPPLDNFLQGYEGSTVYTNPLGVEVLGSAKSIPIADWLLGVTLPTAEAFAPIRAMQQRILLAAIFTTLLVGALTWWMLKSQLFPLLAATKALAAPANTNQPPQPLPITSQDEIGELVGGFNRLLLTLKQREEALKRSEKLYRLLTENIKDVVWTLDIKTMYSRYVSPSVKRLRGYTPEEIVAEPVTEALTPEAAEYLTNLIHSRANSYLSGEEPPEKYYTDEVEHPCKDGSTVWTEAITSYYINPDNGRVELLGVTRDISERKRSDAALRESEVALKSSLAEKEVLLKEVHHRVKNNLAAIMGLVEMQGAVLEDVTARTAMAELSVRIRSMSLVHEQLYHSDNLARIDFQEYLETLISHLRLSYDHTGGIDVSVAAAGVAMSLDNAVPCGLLITELTTNAFKYAFPGGQPRSGANRCEIAVRGTWDGTAYSLEVADNGVGLPQGFDWTTTETLGLTLVGMLGEHQLQGKIEFDGNNGTTFRLRFAPKRQR